MESNARIPHFLDRLSTKIALVAVVFIFALGSAIAFLVAGGLRRTQIDAYSLSQEVLVNQAELALANNVESEARLLSSHLRAAEAAGQQVARSIALFHSLDLSQSMISIEFARSSSGIVYDSCPERLADIWLQNADQAETAGDIFAATGLGEVMASLLEENRDIASIVYHSNAIGLTMRVPPVEDPDPLEARLNEILPEWLYQNAASENNPDRLSIWSDNLSMDHNGAGHIAVSTPVYTGEMFHGVVVVSLPLDHLVEHLNDYQATTRSVAVLLDDAGVPIASADQSNAVGDNISLSFQSDANLTQGYDMSENRSNGYFRAIIESIPVLVAYASLDALPYTLVFIIPLDYLSAQSEQVTGIIWSNAEGMINSTMLTLVGFFIVAVGILLVLLDRLLNRRIRMIITGVRSIAAGNMDVHLQEAPQDELGLLAGAFNHLTGELKRRNKERDEAQTHLEQRVTESTHALQLLYDQSEKRSQELDALYRADEQLYRHLRLDQVLQALVDVTIDQMKADKASVQVWDPARERLVVRAARNFSADVVARMSQYRPGDGIAGKVFLTGEVMAVEDSLHAPQPADQIASMEEIRSTLSVPITINGQIFGVFGMDYHQPRRFTADDTRLFLALAQRAAIAIGNARLYEQAEQAATLEERQRLARELHDAVTQSLYSLVLLSEAARRHAQTGNYEKVEHQMERLGETAQQALKEMRLLVHELRPLALQEVGLVGALQQRLDAVEKRAGIQARLTAQNVMEFPAQLEEALFRIAQEALNNSLKHAAARHVDVRLQHTMEGIELQIADDGLGYEMDSVGNGGIGLKSMQERAERLGMTLTITSSPGNGTIITVKCGYGGSLPISEPQEKYS